jgi:hypothetical protein
MMVPTPVYDSYWRFASERHAIYERRLRDPFGPWTEDPILQQYKFTNAFRAADRVSQYLIREVQYRSDRSQEAAEVFFRTILFKLFNKIETWELLEDSLGPLTWQHFELNRAADLLNAAIQSNQRIYSAAYLMPSPAFGHEQKSSNHLALLNLMMTDQLYRSIATAPSLERVYQLLLAYPGIGPFLAYQYAIDLNYSTLVAFHEADLVVAGPGALDGISKCFHGIGKTPPDEIIFSMVENQDSEFRRLNLMPVCLFGRKLQPIDCQNIFCEISKYARVAFPAFEGTAGRVRIKQRYSRHEFKIVQPMFPPKWDLTIPETVPIVRPRTQESKQMLLFY